METVTVKELLISSAMPACLAPRNGKPNHLLVPISVNLVNATIDCVNMSTMARVSVNYERLMVYPGAQKLYGQSDITRKGTVVVDIDDTSRGLRALSCEQFTELRNVCKYSAPNAVVVSMSQVADALTVFIDSYSTFVLVSFAASAEALVSLTSCGQIPGNSYKENYRDNFKEDPKLKNHFESKRRNTRNAAATAKHVRRRLSANTVLEQTHMPMSLSPKHFDEEAAPWGTLLKLWTAALCVYAGTDVCHSETGESYDVEVFVHVESGQTFTVSSAAITRAIVLWEGMHGSLIGHTVSIRYDGWIGGARAVTMGHVGVLN